MKNQKKHEILDIVLNFNEENHATRFEAEILFISGGDIELYLWDGANMKENLLLSDFDTIEDFIERIKFILS